MVTAPARREPVRSMTPKGLSERRGLAVAGMSASSLPYRPRPNHTVALRTCIVSLAQHHRRYGVRVINHKLQQSGDRVNCKRVERLYRLEKFHCRRRRRKKIPAAERQPQCRPERASEIMTNRNVAASGII